MFMLAQLAINIVAGSQSKKRVAFAPERVRITIPSQSSPGTLTLFAQAGKSLE
jgi:hypothetical protein